MVLLLDVLRDIVEPAVRAVFADGEVEALEVGDAGDGGTLTLRLVALGETYHDSVVQAGVEEAPTFWRERLRSNLVEFVAESPGGWGQDREHGPPS